MTIISNKKSINKGVKSMTAKAMSWNQVCKQISGIGGYVEIGEGQKVRPIDLMWSLGVHVAKNSYKPADIFAAWSERMKDGKQVLMSKGVAYTINLFGFEYKLYNKSVNDPDKYVSVSKKALCPVVSAVDKDPDAHTITVSAANVLRGLQQSVFVDATLDAIDKSEKKCEAMTEGYVNLNRDKKTMKTNPQMVRVEKDKDGMWTIAPEKKVAETAKDVAEKSAKKGTKKSNKKAA